MILTGKTIRPTTKEEVEMLHALMFNGGCAYVERHYTWDKHVKLRFVAFNPTTQNPWRVDAQKPEIRDTGDNYNDGIS